jgi:hypothetical protein
MARQDLDIDCRMCYREPGYGIKVARMQCRCLNQEEPGYLLLDMFLLRRSECSLKHIVTKITTLGVH